MLALVLALLARPLVVLLTLGLARLSWAERAFITWSGLKGAVPILLAAFAVLGDVAGAERVYGVVFVVVLVSVVGQGTPVPVVARALAIPMRERPLLRGSCRSDSAKNRRPRTSSRSARLASGGTAIRDLPLGDDAWVTLVVREGAATRPGGSLELRAGDRVLLLADAEDLEPLARIFAGASEHR